MPPEDIARATTTITFIMRDNNFNVIMASYKQMGDCPVLLAECETLQQVIIMAIKIHISRVCIHSGSLTVINAVNGKLVVPKEIINVVEDIRLLLVSIKRVEYSSRNFNREVNTLAMANM